MNTYLLPVYAVALGVLIAYFTKSYKHKNTKLLLSFSGGFLLALTLFELLPDVYEELEAKTIGILVMAGIVLQIFLESLSKGAEHGHIHSHTKNNVFPWLLLVSLCLHSFIEGFPIHQYNDIVYGVIVHKIPIAIIVTSFMLKSKFSDTITALFLLIFAVMTPLGTIVSNNIKSIIEFTPYINALVIGIFLHISTIILFESSEGHKFNIAKLTTIVLAVVLAYFI